MDVGEDQRRQNMKLICENLFKFFFVLLFLACNISGQVVASDDLQVCEAEKVDLFNQVQGLKSENEQLKTDKQNLEETASSNYRAWEDRFKVSEACEQKLETCQNNTRLLGANSSQQNTTGFSALQVCELNNTVLQEKLARCNTSNSTTPPSTPDTAKSAETPRTPDTAETPTNILVDNKANTSSGTVFWLTALLVVSLIMNVLFCMCCCKSYTAKNVPVAATQEDFRKLAKRVEDYRASIRLMGNLKGGIFTNMMRFFASDFSYFLWIELKTYPVYIMDFFCVIDNTLLVTLWLMISLVVFVSYELYHQASYAKSMEDVNFLASWVFEKIQMLLNWLNVDVKWLIAPVYRMANQHLCPPAYG